MPIFHNVDGKLKKLSLLSLDKEKKLQKLIEGNLMEVLDMKFLASEYSTTHGGRIDTIAIDSNGAPVLIEYKRTINQQVIPQALFYLTWLKSQTIEFFEGLIRRKLEIEKLPKIDWHNPRVICIAESYNTYDIVGFKVIPGLELYKFHFYEDDIFVLDMVSGEDEKHESILNNISEKVSDKIFVQDVQNDLTNIIVTDLQEANKTNLENQFRRKPPEIKVLFEKLKSKIFKLDENIYEKANTNNIVFRILKMFAEAHIQNDNILIYLREVKNDYPKDIVSKVPKKYGWGKKISVRIRNDEELNYIMPLIEQSYKDIL